ncbi:ankyrin repeat domain-containing protein 26-like [Antechinus flavipes]|uniref:ankyrin repeat domain-containing protein 26-like n=1 Tax=Antechinus flavipes TaxID=38775 RepID=UPI002236693F|nr:ankyrin repeat domain-containing protein 26-like [Antechinus flavipes]
MKIFNLDKKAQSTSLSFITPRTYLGAPEPDSNAGYLIQEKHLGKLHKAVSIGDMAKEQQLLLGKHSVKDLYKIMSSRITKPKKNNENTPPPPPSR